MPYCKNDNKKSYKGNEPSPKGLGYCAHMEELGSKKKGFDGNIWIIKNTKNGSKRWIKFNKETEKNSKKEKKDHKKNNISIIKLKREKKNSTKSKIYYTHNNGKRPYKVIVEGKIVYIYKSENNNYTTLVKIYLTEKIFIGKSTGLNSWSDSQNYIFNHTISQSKLFDGNSVLLKLVDDKYIFIGHEIYEFKLKNNDIVEEYYSAVGNNDVPYPVILGHKNIYYMLDKKYVERKYFSENMQSIDWESSYTKFYGKWTYIGKKAQTINSLYEYSKDIKNVKIIDPNI